MIKLKSLLSEFLLREIGDRTTLYHRSSIKLKVGDVIKPKVDEKGTHWLTDKPFELALENYRQHYHKDKPSRLNCVYSSLVPRSRFVDKGFLYEIKPTGKIHIVDSRIIDESANEFDDRLYQSGEYRNGTDEDKKDLLTNPNRLANFLSGGMYYWNGTTPNKNNVKDIEVLSDSAVVIREIIESEKTKPLSVGDRVLVTEDNKLVAWLDVYLNGSEGKGVVIPKPKYTLDEAKKLKDWCEKNLYSKVESSTNIDVSWAGTHFQIKGDLKKGIVLKIINIESAGAREKDDIGKYAGIMFDFYKDGKLISRDRIKNDTNISHRFHTSSYLYYGRPRVFNFSQYLKKI